MLSWLFGSTKKEVPYPLLMVPLTDSEIARQGGFSRQHEERLGLFPQEIIDAIDKHILGEIDKMVALESPGGMTLAEIFFKPGEPKTFEDYGGQQHITRFLTACLNGLRPHEPLTIAPQVFAGAAGGGKTLLAKVAANEMRARACLRGQPLTEFIEVFTTDIPNVAALDALMRRVYNAPGCVLFIDELHSIQGKEHWQKFLEVLENFRYRFDNDSYPTVMPKFTILAATTDYGSLEPQWRRRFEEQRFERSTYPQLLHYVNSRGVMPIESDASKAIVDRTHWGGAPWESLWAYNMAVVFAKERRSQIITPKDVKEVWKVNRVDELGLRPVDRDVMKALFRCPRHRRAPQQGQQEFVCYAASEDNVCQLAGVDRAEYREYIRPKLMNRGLLEIRISYGQALTKLAEDSYGQLRT